MKHLTIRWSNQLVYLICYLLFSLSLSVGSGCQFAPKDKPISWPWKKDEVKPLPDRILTVWTDSVLHQPKQAGVRGFGGRLYFYGKDGTDPIEVDGSLAVYVFDADDINLNSQKPLRKFVFTADQFKDHMSKTSIGRSYSVWLPWGEIGGPPRRLSLIARFEGREGGTTISDPTIKLLPGVPTQEHSDQELTGNQTGTSSPFRLSGYQQGTKLSASKERKLEEEEQQNEKPASDSKSEIKTIDLPPSFQRHLRGAVIESSQQLTPTGQDTTKDHFPSADQTSVSEVNAAIPPAAQVDPTGTAEQETEHAPVTTQVFDYRSRARQGYSMFGTPKTDIRQGRWINSISR